MFDHLLGTVPNTGLILDKDILDLKDRLPSEIPATRNALNLTILSHPKFQAALDQLVSLFGYEQRWLLAGGFLRDLVLGLEPRDLDVFVPPSTDIPTLAKMLLKGKTSGGYEDLAIDSVWKLLGHKPYPVEIIRTTTRNETTILRGFDFGICQIGFSSSDGILFTPAFLQDIKHKQMTYNEEEWRGGLNLAHQHKLKKKLPMFALNRADDTYVD